MHIHISVTAQQALCVFSRSRGFTRVHNCSKSDLAIYQSGRGGCRGGGVLGVRTPPPPLGDPKTSKRGKNVARVRANTTRFST